MLSFRLCPGVCQGIEVHQTPSSFIRKPGDNVQLVCTHGKTDYRVMLWYQQSPGDTAMTLIGYLNIKNPNMEEDYKKHFKLAGDLSGTTAKNGSLIIQQTGAEHSAFVVCSGSYPAYFGEGTRLTVLEYNVTAPTVKILPPSSKECKKKKKTLVCVASGFYPDHVSVFWQIDGVDVTDGVATDNNAVRKNESYSITSRLRVLAEDWRSPDRTFTCTVTFFNGTGYEPHSDSVHGTAGNVLLHTDMIVCAKSSGSSVMTSQAGKLSYAVFLAKSSLYALFITALVWKLKVCPTSSPACTMYLCHVCWFLLIQTVICVVILILIS
uniref:Ig-like domain-containing protein n=1 Tax=Myripristis murdjan TaxID=586833 RepID=A0A667Z0P0_9TELE